MDRKQNARPILEVRAIEGINSIDYGREVFKAFDDGLVAAMVSPGTQRRHIPGARIVSRVSPDESFGWFDETISGEMYPPEKNAFIAFSSGTTGQPKAILLPHGALGNVVTRLNKAMEVDQSIREYIGVPINFSFGFARLRAAAVAGGRSFLPQHGFNPSEIAKMLKAGEINALSAVPTLWRILLQNKDIIGDVGKKLRWVEIGSQYMSGAEKLEIRNLFPNAKIIQHYGLTEASRATFLDVSEAPETHLESIGTGFDDAEIKLSDDGKIMVRGPHVASGIVTGAGIKPITDKDGWLTTNDLGRSEDGYFYFEGRTDDLINCGGIKIPAAQFEQKLIDALGANSNEIAVGKISDVLRGEQILVVCRAENQINPADLKEKAIEIAGVYGLSGAAALALHVADEFPTTKTGKLKRSVLPQVSRPAFEVPRGQFIRGEVTDCDAVTPGNSSAPSHSASQSDDRIKLAFELQAVWEECLGISPVEITDNFYDLGGDSLSAVSVMIRMEKLGTASDMAAGIFEGKSIAEIVGLDRTNISHVQSGGRADPPLMEEEPAPFVADKKAQQIIAVWEDCLGVRPIALTESFFDLGGDSLSAVKVMLRMERIGIDAGIAKGIFDGRTIAEILDLEGIPTKPNTVAAPVGAGRQGVDFMTLAGAVNSVHAVRGILIYLVIFVHWVPGVFARLPGDWDALLKLFNPVFRMGTPGFAIVFGLGIGALRTHQFRLNEKRFGASVLRNAAFLFGGVALLAVFNFGQNYVNETLDDPIIISRIFYSALAFYFLVSLTEGFLIKIATSTQSVILNFLMMAIAAIIGFDILRYYFEGPSTQGVSDLIRLMATSKYGYFNMVAAVLIGAAIGFDFRERHKSSTMVRDYLLAGVGIAAFGLFLSLRADPIETLFTMTSISPWHLIFYSGVVLLILAMMAYANRANASGRFLKRINRALIASGMLALPLFVGHEIVRPMMQILAAVGVSSTIALIVPLTLFIGLIFVAYRKIYRIFLR